MKSLIRKGDKPEIGGEVTGGSTWADHLPARGTKLCAMSTAQPSSTKVRAFHRFRTFSISDLDREKERRVSRDVTFSINGGYYDEPRSLDCTRAAKSVLL
jgi:hypothetical protein